MNIYLIVTHRYDLIEYQVKLIEKHVAGVDGISVANNGPLGIVIENEAKRLGLPFISLDRPGADLNPSWKTAWALQCLWDHHISGTNANVMFVDLDVFPVAKCRPIDWLQDAHIAAPVNVAGAASYPFPGLLAVRADVCQSGDRLEFGCDTICGNHCDTGGALVRWLLSRDRAAWRHLDIAPLAADEIPDKQSADGYDPAFGFHFFADKSWVHITKCTNWINYPQDFIDRKERVMFGYLNSLLQS